MSNSSIDRDFSDDGDSSGVHEYFTDDEDAHSTISYDFNDDGGINDDFALEIAAMDVGNNDLSGEQNSYHHWNILAHHQDVIQDMKM